MRWFWGLKVKDQSHAVTDRVGIQVDMTTYVSSFLTYGNHILIQCIYCWTVLGRRRSEYVADCFSEQYSEILRKRWVEVFNRIFDEDNYTAILVETPEEYERIASVYPFKDAALEQVQWIQLILSHTLRLYYFSLFIGHF